MSPLLSRVPGHNSEADTTNLEIWDSKLRV